jgi:hypothetical protein
MAYDETIVEHSATAHQHHMEVMKALGELKQLELKEGDKMSEKVDLHLNGMGGGNDAALMAMLAGQNSGNNGMNALWPLLLLGLNNRNGGLLGGNEGAGGVGLQNSIDTNAILQTLGDIKASVPLSEAQVQLALAGATASLSNSIAGSKDATVNAAANIGNLIQQVNNALGDKVDANTTQQAIGFGGINSSIERTGWQLSQTITTDGDKTRALISSIDRENLNRQLIVAENALAEERTEHRRSADRHGIEINMINNQSQNQLQMQQQSQAISQISHCLGQALQSIQATNQAINIGGFQQANPTNTNTNVKT